jgi:hypothetical protein
LTTATKIGEPIDEYAATVVLDEHEAAGGKAPAATGETMTDDCVQDIEAALRRDLWR